MSTAGQQMNWSTYIYNDGNKQQLHSALCKHLMNIMLTKKQVKGPIYHKIKKCKMKCLEMQANMEKTIKMERLPQNSGQQLLSLKKLYLGPEDTSEVKSGRYGKYMHMCVYIYIYTHTHTHMMYFTLKRNTLDNNTTCNSSERNSNLRISKLNNHYMKWLSGKHSWTEKKTRKIHQNHNHSSGTTGGLWYRFVHWVFEVFFKNWINLCIHYSTES